MLAFEESKWRAPLTRRTIPPVFGPRSAAGLSAVALLLVNLPYLVAPSLTAPQSSFSGFLLNPIDGHSYLAKIRQGAAEPLEFRLPYAAEPGDGALLFVYYLVLGRVGSRVGLAPLTMVHSARVLGAAAMFAATYLFVKRILAPGRAQWAAFGLALFGTGIGWLAVPFGLTPVDLQVPEAIPFMTAYVNAHFPAAAALLLFSVTAIASSYPAWLIYLASLGLSLIQPFGSLTVGAALGAWALVEAIVRRKSPIAQKAFDLICDPGGEKHLAVADRQCDPFAHPGNRGFLDGDHAVVRSGQPAEQAPQPERHGSRDDAERILGAAPGLRLEKVPAHGHAIGSDDVLVGRVRADYSAENGLALFLICDNLRKGAALNAIQIAELLVGASLPSYFGQRAS